MRPRLPVIAASIALAGATIGLGAERDQRGVAGAQATPPPQVPTPCQGPQRTRLRCPDLLMGTPADMYAERTSGGRVLLRATNNVKSRGKGPVMFRGRRTGPEEMSARQHIYRVNGTRLIADTGAELYFKLVPGQGHYWKFQRCRELRALVRRSGGTPPRARSHGPQGLLLPARPVPHRALEALTSPPRVPWMQPGSRQAVGHARHVDRLVGRLPVHATTSSGST